MKKDDMPKNSGGSVVGVVVDGGLCVRGDVIRKENDEEEFTSETDTKTNPAIVVVVVVVVVRFNEAQKTALSEKSAFSNSRGLDIM